MELHDTCVCILYLTSYHPFPIVLRSYPEHYKGRIGRDMRHLAGESP